jgi:hypothetical protein
MLKRTLLAAGLAATLGFAAVPSQAVTVYVHEAPPPLRVETVPAPRAGYQWVAGHWDYRDNRYVWVEGTWMPERVGYRYEGPTWVQRDGNWYYREGEWRRHDRDGDGVPNRDDRAPDNPYRQ